MITADDILKYTKLCSLLAPENTAKMQLLESHFHCMGDESVVTKQVPITPDDIYDYTKLCTLKAYFELPENTTKVQTLESHFHLLGQ